MDYIYDIMVIGLGANGSSAVYNLSKTGLSVCGIDRFRPPHHHGSSHGQSRIIRQAYYEDPLYVPFIREAYQLWNEIEHASGHSLLLKTGGMMLGKESAAVIKGSLNSAKQHGIAYEYLNSSDIEKRFPALIPGQDTVGVLEKDAGILFPERCIQSFLSGAQKNGAALHFDERVISITPLASHVEVVTAIHTYRAARLIIAAGAWVNELLPELQLPLSIERQVLYWFRNKKEASRQYFSSARLPVYIWEYAAGKMFYGFPDLGDGIKIAHHHAGRPVVPDELTNDVSALEIADMAAVVARYLNIDAELNYSATCMYTNTPDQRFILDFHPQHPNIFIASPCSGHGFKFSSLTGKLCCELILGHAVPFDLSPFRISRLE